MTHTLKGKGRCRHSYMSNAKPLHHILWFYFALISNLICSLVSVSLHHVEGFELHVLVPLCINAIVPSFFSSLSFGGSFPSPVHQKGWSYETFQKSSLIWLKMSLLIAGSRTSWPLKVPSKKNYSMVLWFKGCLYSENKHLLATFLMPGWATTYSAVIVFGFHKESFSL